MLMAKTTQEVSQKESQNDRRCEKNGSKFKELKARAKMAKFEQNAKQEALAAIAIPLLRFFTCLQFFLLFFAVYARVPTLFLVVYVCLATLSVYAVFQHGENPRFAVNFIHLTVVFHGFFGVFLYGWGCGNENFLIWGIATSYFIFIGKNRTMFAFIAIETVAYVLLYIFRDKFGIVNLGASGNVMFGVSFVAIFVSFLRRTNTLGLIYAKSINEVVTQNDKLEFASKFDFLTGLDNRRYAQEQFDEISVHFPDQKVLVALGDIDDFKIINDTFGHDVGDMTIKEIARILRENSRGEKDILCRWGGEEFLLVALVHDDVSAQDMVKRVLKSINTLSAPDGKKIGITFGATVFENVREMSLNEMAAAADELLYEGKRDGKNCIKFKGCGDVA